VTATARKLAVLFYQALRFGMTYADPGASYYEERYRQRAIHNLHGTRHTESEPGALSRGAESGDDLWALPLKGDRKPVLFLRTEFNEREGRFSPDGDWVAYTSDASGGRRLLMRVAQPNTSPFTFVWNWEEALKR
jgi:hypothetical protein